jgi:adenylate cyclase
MKWFGNLRQRVHRPWFGSGLGAVLVPLVGLCLLGLPIGRGFVDWSYDLPFLMQPSQNITNVEIVTMDETLYHALGQSPARFDRTLHAQLVTNLNAQGAKLIVFDMVFLDAEPGTSHLAEAMQERTNVVISAELVETRQSGALGNKPIWPLEPLANSARSVGLANISPDPDSCCRLFYPGKEQLPSLAWQTAALYRPGITNSQHLIDERWLNYYSLTPFDEISYLEVLSNKWPAGFSLSNKVVFIGEAQVTGYVGEKKEEFGSPWQHFGEGRFYGVEVHALGFSNLVRDDWLGRLPSWMEALLIILAGAMLGYGLSLLRPLAATAAALAAALFVAACGYLLFAMCHTWFPWLIIAGAQVPVGLGWAYLVDSIRSYVERRLLERSLELYLSPRQVKEILKQPELLKPGAREKTVSILFSDIANFSKASEILPPNDLVKLLNDYYEVAIASVHQTGGTVMNLIADAIFAIWNAPQEQPDHQKLACEAAVLLNQNVIRFNAEHESIALRTRIGLHTGIACVGNIGSTTHFDYAAVGESVNMASRLEGLNKKLKTNILATREIQSSLDGALVSRFIGYFRFKGLVQIDQVHELIGPAQLEAESREWRTAFSEALRCWKARQFGKAEEYFRRTLELRPKSEHAGDDEPADGPSDFYLKLIPEFLKHPPPPEWLGEIDLRGK